MQIALAFISVVLSASMAGTADDEIGRLLSLEPSVGSVAVLVPYAADARVQQRLGEAVVHSDPDVRSVAARVALVTGSRSLMPVLRSQIERETDLLAAGEQIRTIATFSTAVDDRYLVAVAQRLKGPVGITLAEVLARVRPASLAAYAPLLAETTRPLTLGEALVVASIREPQIASSIARSSLRAGPKAWRALLDGRHDRNLPVDGEILIDSLQSSDVESRLATLSYVAMLVGHPLDELDKEVVRIISDRAEHGPPNTWEAALGELVRRSTDKPFRPIDWTTLLGGDQSAARYLADVNADLLGDERKQVEKLLGRRLPDGASYASANSRITRESWLHSSRIVPIFAGRLLSDVMRLTGCQPGPRTLAAAEIGYRPDGRPQVVKQAEMPLSDACRDAADALFSLVVAPVQYVSAATSSDGVLLPFTERFMACTDARPEPPVAPIDAPQPIEPPRISDMPEPRYPDAVKPHRIAGVVTVSMDITSAGCVRSAATTRSLHPALDAEAIRAVLNARWTPLRAGHHAVASQVTMGIRFDP